MKDHDLMRLLGPYSVIESGFERVFIDSTQ